MDYGLVRGEVAIFAKCFGSSRLFSMAIPTPLSAAIHSLALGLYWKNFLLVISDCQFSRASTRTHQEDFYLKPDNTRSVTEEYQHDWGEP